MNKALQALLGALPLMAGDVLAGSIELLRDLDSSEVTYSTGAKFLGSTQHGLLLTLSDQVHPARLYVASGNPITPRALGGNAPSIDFVAPTNEFQFGQSVLFTAWNASGQSVWRADGTDAGTVRLVSGAATWLGRAGGAALFLRRDPTNIASEFYSIWRTDGSPAGTLQLDIGAGQRVESTWSIGTHLYFTVSAGGAPTALKVTDGTQAGTRDVIALGTGSLTNIQEVMLAGTATILCARDAAGLALFRLNSSGPAATRLANLSGFRSCSRMQESVIKSGPYYFFVADGVLWSTDGTAASITALTSPPSISLANGVQLPLGQTAAGVVFALDDGTQAPAIWKSDGTPAGTTPLFDPGSQSYAQIVSSANGGVFFLGGFPVQKLYRTNGDPAGTREVPLRGGGNYDLEQIQQVFVTPTQIYLHSRVDGISGTPQPWWRTDHAGTDLIRLSNGEDGPGDVAGERLYFQSNGVDGSSLATSDGSVAGTAPIQIFPPSGKTGSSAPREFENLGNMLLFAATTRSAGRELWRTDGTSAGSVQVRDINPGVSSANPRNLWRAGSLVYFIANDSDVVAANSARLWRTDGTSSGTFSLDVPPPVPALVTCKAWIALHNGRAYFFSEYYSPQMALMSTDGTTAGTRQEAFLPADVTNPCNLSSVSGRLVFSARQQGEMRLWSTSGSADDIQSITPASVSGSFIRDQSKDLFVSSGNYLYFAGSESNLDVQLWKTDGTASGTSRVTTFPKGTLASPEVSVAQLGDRVLVNYANLDASVQASTGLYISDGTGPTTSLLKAGVFWNVTSAGDMAYFTTRNSTQTEQLGITDGTVAGTRIHFSASQVGGTIGANRQVGHGGVLFLTGPIDGGQSQLWMSDGTVAGTHALSRFANADGALVDQEPIAILDGRPLVVFAHNSYGEEPYIVRNAPPQSAPDAATVVGNTNVQINVLGNDSDPDGSIDKASLQVIDRPANGSISIEANQVRYTPNAGFTGTDSFRYRPVDDFGATSPVVATVTITVTAPPPTNGGGNGTSGSTSGGGSLGMSFLLLLASLAGSQLVRHQRIGTGRPIGA